MPSSVNNIYCPDQITQKNFYETTKQKPTKTVMVWTPREATNRNTSPLEASSKFIDYE